MVNTLSILNYKSIRYLDIKTSRVNIFIGEHNSGKSNILEALGWLSVGILENDTFSEVLRFKNASDFFYDFDATKFIEVKTDKLSLGLKYGKNPDGALRNEFDILIYDQNFKSTFSSLVDFYNLKESPTSYQFFTLSHEGKLELRRGSVLSSSFRLYVFKRIKSFRDGFRPFLNPPFGENIPSLLISNKSYQETVRDLFRSKGFRLMLKPSEGDISMAKDVNDELYAYPYQAISETLQRMVFYTLAIESNKNSILILDEPEANAFPMYTKQLAEMMASDVENQYFLATHNPYLLSSLVAKTPVDDLSVFVTSMEDYETTVKKVPTENLAQLLDRGVDAFFNLNKLVEA